MLNLNKKYEDCLLVSQCNELCVPDEMQLSNMYLTPSMNKA